MKLVLRPVSMADLDDFLALHALESRRSPAAMVWTR